MARRLPATLALALVASIGATTLAPPAFGQDHFDQMVNAVKERKERSYHQVMTAPAKVQDYIRHTDLDIGVDKQPSAERVANPLDKDGSEGWTATEFVCIALGLALIGGFMLTRKLATR